MVQSASIGGGPLIYRGVETLRTSDRATAIAVVIALHAAVIGVFVVAKLRPPPPPPETTLSVSFITENAVSPAPTPPQPQPPTPPRPEPRLMATAAQTPSPMSAPPIEKVTPQQQAPAPPAPPAPPAAPSAPSANDAPAAVSPPNFTAAYLNNPGPVYPMTSRRKREQGTVRLRVQVSPDGAPLQVLLERTSSYSDLDAAALDVVKKRWRFAPAKQGDRTVTAWVIVPMQFSLDR